MATTSRDYSVQSPGEGLIFENYINDVASVVEHTNARPVLLGYSHAAFFTVHYAIANPKKISALVLIEPALFNEREELLSRAQKALDGDEAGSVKQLLGIVQPELSEDPNLANAYTRLVQRSTESANAVGMELLARADNPISTEMLSSLSMPVLLMGGTKSFAAYTVHRAAAALPFAFTWWIDGATHLDIMAEFYADKVSLGVDSFCSVLGLSKPNLAL